MIGSCFIARAGKDNAIDRRWLGQLDRQVCTCREEPSPRLAVDCMLRTVGSGKVFDRSRLAGGTTAVARKSDIL